MCVVSRSHIACNLHHILSHPLPYSTIYTLTPSWGRLKSYGFCYLHRLALSMAGTEVVPWQQHPSTIITTAAHQQQVWLSFPSLSPLAPHWLWPLLMTWKTLITHNAPLWNITRMLVVSFRKTMTTPITQIWEFKRARKWRKDVGDRYNKIYHIIMLPHICHIYLPSIYGNTSVASKTRAKETIHLASCWSFSTIFTTILRGLFQDGL